MSIFDDENRAIEFYEPISPYDKRLYQVVKRLKEYENQIISRDLVYRILFEELSKFKIISRSALREYYHNLRDLDVIREMGKERINGKLTMKVKIQSDGVKNILYFDESYHNGLRCAFCGQEFKNHDELIEHKSYYCEKNPYRTPIYDLHE